ncbi:MAG: hypothetical protein COB15_14385 [Flavobacteriales bacterium]|nr:MAG: hypothetical protein COB15_14385 [Flavobacteriales bacterium]
MKHLIYILIGLFVLCSTANNSYGQFWKKKGGSSKKDAFSGKSKKGPNIYSSKPPRGKSRSKLYGHSVSKKRLKKKSGPGFSSTKGRYKSTVNSKPKKGGKGTSGSSGGRKSGKGRKKEK